MQNNIMNIMDFVNKVLQVIGERRASLTKHRLGSSLPYNTFLSTRRMTSKIKHGMRGWLQLRCSRVLNRREITPSHA